MTITVSFSTVADSISNLSISGVTIKDINQIPDSASMLCPLLIPQPNGFVSEITPTFETFGSNGTPKINMMYTLNYVFLHSEVGSGISAFDGYSDLMAKLELIFEAILSNDVVTGAVDFKLQSVSNVGVITDPAGLDYWGVLLSFRVLEYSQ